MKGINRPGIQGLWIRPINRTPTIKSHLISKTTQVTQMQLGTTPCSVRTKEGAIINCCMTIDHRKQSYGSGCPQATTVKIIIRSIKTNHRKFIKCIPFINRLGCCGALGKVSIISTLIIPLRNRVLTTRYSGQIRSIHPESGG